MDRQEEMDILRKLNYVSPEKVNEAIEEANKYFNVFQRRTFPHGGRTVVGLCGDLPVPAVGENVPLRILFSLSFPSQPPIVQVNKTDTMLVNPSAPLTENTINSSYVRNWDQSSSLVDLLQGLIIEFTDFFPVFNLNRYEDWKFVKGDISAVLQQHPKLIAKWKKTVCEEPAQLFLQGSLTLPIHHQANISTTILLPLSFPKTAPEIHIQTNEEVEHFDTSGWKYPGSSLKETVGCIVMGSIRQTLDVSTESPASKQNKGEDALDTRGQRIQPKPKPRKSIKIKQDEIAEFIKSEDLSENTEIQLRKNGFTTVKGLQCIREEDLKKLELNMAELCMLRKSLDKIGQKHSATVPTTEDAHVSRAGTNSFKDVLCQTFKEQIRDILVTNEQLELGEEIGRGQYGVVRKALLRVNAQAPAETVAVKTISASRINSEKNKQAIATEIIQMSMLRHKNVLRLRAVCFSEDIPSLVLPFVAKGNLLDFLRKQREPLPMDDLLSMALDVAKGMQYLNEQDIIHCDLAARNCLVDDDGSVKISDFGLARKLMTSNYMHLSSGAKMPWKWIAPEVLTERKITLQSDVWSYGVLLWEIMTQGKEPHSEIPDSDCLLKRIKDGYRMQCSENTPQTVKEIMFGCWDLDPKRRPNFSEIIQDLTQMDSYYVKI